MRDQLTSKPCVSHEFITRERNKIYILTSRYKRLADLRGSVAVLFAFNFLFSSPNNGTIASISVT